MWVARATVGRVTTTDAGPVTDDAFAALTEPLRRELVAHCYRMVGSLHEAEDLVQETYLRAWRAFHGFEHRSSVRTWMYRIATNTCLTALEGRARRPLPAGIGAPSDPHVPVQERPDIPWLEPVPDDVLWSAPAEDPGDVAAGRETVRLAFIAALQHLTPQQRAVLLLKDVLGWQASEIAQTLDLTVAAVNSTLQRARAHVEDMTADARPTLPADDPRLAELLEQYCAAFEAYDVQRIVELLTEDARWDMPPYPEWFLGAETIGRLIATQCPAEGPGSMRMLRTSANGAPAFGLYMLGADGVHRPFQLQHLTVTDDGVSAVTAFFGGPDLFGRFGLPPELRG